MWEQDIKKNIAYYTSLVAKHGISVKSLDWGSTESQQLRFAVLADVGNVNGVSILDVGCGLGDLWGWLKKSGKSAHYTGLDITSQMVKLAEERFPDAVFKLGNLLEFADEFIGKYDYVMASGIFAHMESSSFLFMQKMIARMFDICNKAVAFNSLSMWAPQKDVGEYCADPLEVLKYCKELTPWVVLRHDYHPRDFTIYMYKKC